MKDGREVENTSLLGLRVRGNRQEKGSWLGFLLASHPPSILALAVKQNQCNKWVQKKGPGAESCFATNCTCDKPLSSLASIRLTAEKRSEQTRHCPSPCQLPELGSFVLFWVSPHLCAPSTCSGETEEKQGWALLQRPPQEQPRQPPVRERQLHLGEFRAGWAVRVCFTEEARSKFRPGSSQTSSSLKAQPLGLDIWTQIPAFPLTLWP